MATIGYNIRVRRQQLNMEQRELAQKIGTTAPAVCNIERNRSQPKMQTLIKIAAALDCTPGELLSGVNGKEVS